MSHKSPSYGDCNTQTCLRLLRDWRRRDPRITNHTSTKLLSKDRTTEAVSSVSVDPAAFKYMKEMEVKLVLYLVWFGTNKNYSFNVNCCFSPELVPAVVHIITLSSCSLPSEVFLTSSLLFLSVSVSSRRGPGPGPGVSGVPGGSGSDHGRSGVLCQPLQVSRHDGDLLRHHGDEDPHRAGRTSGGGGLRGETGWIRHHTVHRPARTRTPLERTVWLNMNRYMGGVIRVLFS